MGQVIKVEDWARIRHLHQAEGLSARAIARELGIARDTVARALASSLSPRYRSRPKVASAWSWVEPGVRALLSQYPDMPATVLAERTGWSGSITWFRENVARLRPGYVRVDPADRLAHLPGEQVQCDLWFPPVKVGLGFGQAASRPVLVMVASHSRFITAVMLPSPRTPDLLAGMWRLISTQLGRCRAVCCGTTRLASGVAGAWRPGGCVSAYFCPSPPRPDVRIAPPMRGLILPTHGDLPCGRRHHHP